MMEEKNGRRKHIQIRQAKEKTAVHGYDEINQRYEALGKFGIGKKLNGGKIINIYPYHVLVKYESGYTESFLKADVVFGLIGENANKKRDD